MEGTFILYLFVLFLAIFLGIELISKVPSTLHTPLMSATNAIHGIVIVGTLLIAGTAVPALGPVLAFIAVVLGTLNVVGGFVVTDRMLKMFKKKGSR
ncbi:MAG: NAD(P) transhydrogenase subunit alpha [Nitrospirae bacterium]|nr:NAD(P) transhydrogenase subunit alpha [Nitrospirota bacterium]